jgi:glutamate dehydrogenase (NADP+)
LWDHAGKYLPGEKPWKSVEKADIALPCATQNELDSEDVYALVKAGVTVVCEGANMPSTGDAIEAMHENNIEFGPAKAANAGGVAVSGLEMSQNSQRLQWTASEVDAKLQDIMESIFNTCDDTAKEYGTTLQAGANIAGFLKVATAMEAQGIV